MKEANAISSNRVFQTICALDYEIQKSLIKFLNSPYFNQSKILISLGGAFVAESVKKKEGFSKEKIWSKVFGVKPYNDINFRKACSDLLELVELFMATEMYLATPKKIAIDKIEYVTNKKITPLFKKTISENERLFNLKEYFTQNDYFYLYQYEKSYYKLMNFDVRANQKINIEKISDNIDVFYLIDKLKILCNALVQKLISAVDYDLNDVKSVLKLCEKYDLNEYAELGIYFYSYNTLIDGDNLQHYFNLKALLEKNAKLIPQEQGIEIFDTSLNYCIGRVNKGDKQFLKEYFEIFLSAIQEGIFVENGSLAPWRLNNIVVAGLRLGKIEWAEQFVQEYKALLPIDLRQNIVKFNLARIASYKKDYQTVLDLVRDIEYDDIIINLISKTMIVFAYYEMDEYDPLDSFIESFRTFINRQKDIQPGLKNGYLNLLGFVRRLTRVKPGESTSLDKLKTDITAIKTATINHEWLLEKIEELS